VKFDFLTPRFTRGYQYFSRQWWMIFAIPRNLH
jgi:hypothetical protein